jgi:hypothetical protein
MPLLAGLVTTLLVFGAIKIALSDVVENNEK